MHDARIAGQLWRKNTHPVSCADPNSWGIDLNRNYPYNWGCCGGSSGSGSGEADPATGVVYP
jgi:hypothetical protein